jgi:hypothetical protein
MSHFNICDGALSGDYPTTLSTNPVSEMTIGFSYKAATASHSAKRASIAA